MTDTAIAQSRDSINQLLENNPTEHQIRCRIRALVWLMEDCARFYPIPTLVESLRKDIERLRQRLPAGSSTEETT